MQLGLGNSLVMQRRQNGGSSLSNDTGLGLFEIDGVNVIPNVGGSIDVSNEVAGVSIAATPTHPGATRTINGSSAANPRTMLIEVGDQDATVVVTAEDGVTQETYVVTVHKLTAGRPEITTADFTGLTGANFLTGGSGLHIVLNQGNSGRTHPWFNTGSENAPGVGLPIEVLIGIGDTDNDIANAFANTIDAANVGGGTGWHAARSGAVVTVTDAVVGIRDNAYDYNSNIVVVVFEDGEDPL